MKPRISVTKETIFAINTNLLFSYPNILDINNIIIASGTIAKLIIPIASAASINFGKNIGINFGKTKNPNSEIPIEIIMMIFLIFLLEISLASWGNKYLNAIDENIIKIVKCWCAKE